MSISNKSLRRQKLRWGIRHKINGTAQRPRLSVFRSNNEIYAQLIDDATGTTLAAASSRQKGLSGQAGNKTAIATSVGKAIGEAAKELGIVAAVFDRGGYLYHGRVKALAEGAREAGLTL